MTARFREISGLALVAVGVAGAAILGTDHALVRRSRAWLEKKGFLKPQS